MREPVPLKDLVQDADRSWRSRRWSDGCTQVYNNKRFKQERSNSNSSHFIELEESVKGVRRQWHVVTRPADTATRWPKIVAGPFPTLEAAQAAYLLVTST